MQDNKPLLISVEQARQRLGVSRGTMYKLVHEPGFPALRIGRAVRVSISGLEGWINEQSGREESE